MPTIENAIRYGQAGRLNAHDKAVFAAMNAHQDYIWDLNTEDIEELQNFAEEQFRGSPNFTKQQLRASVHKLHKKELIGRVRIGTTSTAKRTYPGRWHYGSHEVCKLAEAHLRQDHLYGLLEHSRKTKG